MHGKTVLLRSYQEDIGAVSRLVECIELSMKQTNVPTSLTVDLSDSLDLIKRVKGDLNRVKQQLKECELNVYRNEKLPPPTTFIPPEPMW